MQLSYEPEPWDLDDEEDEPEHSEACMDGGDYPKGDALCEACSAESDWDESCGWRKWE